MYLLESATPSGGGADGAARNDVASVHDASKPPSEQLPTVIYLDARALLRDCIGSWLQSSLSGFRVCVFPDPDQLATAAIVKQRVRAVLINVGADQPRSSNMVARLVSRVSELLPDCAAVVLSDREDSLSIRAAFALGVRGYIPTSLASPVALEAVRLVCVGGSFAPTAALLCQAGHGQRAAVEALRDEFTPRQWQVLDRLRRGTANKQIAAELNICESTVKVHMRNAMKKLAAANRTELVHLTRDLFQG